MSSSDPTHRGATPKGFTPHLPAATVRGTMTVASVFPDLEAGAHAATNAPPPEPGRRDELEHARQQGYAAGFAEGQAAAERALVAGASAFADAVEEVTRFRRGLLARYERELLELALGVARRVIQRELAEHPEHWLEMIRDAVRRALDRESLRIRVGPVLHRFLLERLPRLRALLEDVKELDLVEDPALGETGCVIESRYGDLDLGVDGQMTAIRAALTGGA